MRYAALAMRYLLAAVFIFSGFVKGVDPWGTAIKLGEYLSAMGLDFLSPLTFTLSILLSGAELALGIGLAVGVLRRAVSFCVMLFMAFFTLLTLYIAIWNPVEDCGCFGDALKLTNWQTFFKNIVLLPMSFIVWRAAKGAVLSLKKGAIAFAAIFVLSSMVGVYSYCHLPLIDFLPYKVGTDLSVAASTIDVGQGDVKTVLIYRNIQSGKMQEFSLEETEWQDESKWEFVDTKVDFGEPILHNSSEFAIFSVNADVTQELLTGKVYLLCVTNPERLPAKCETSLAEVIAHAKAQNAKVAVISPSDLPVSGDIKIGQSVVPIYNIDATTLKTMLRALNGVITLNDGVVVDKKNCTDWK